MADTVSKGKIWNRKRALHHKVRTGCVTCRIRRVKCDETRPDCNRCTSTGRKCDGYDLQVKEQSLDDSTQSQSASPRPNDSSRTSISHNKHHSIESPPIRPTPSFSKPRPLAPAPQASLSTSSRDESFQNTVRSPFPCPVILAFLPLVPTARTESFLLSEFRTHLIDFAVPQIPGDQTLRLLLLQVSESHPAIRHAILALTSAYTCFMSAREPLTIKDSQRCAYIHYNRAITHLNSKTSVSASQSSDSNFRITLLISCLLFAEVEMLLGRGIEARMHIKAGQRIAAEARVRFRHQSPSTDDHIWSIDRSFTFFATHCGVSGLGDPLHHAFEKWDNSHGHAAALQEDNYNFTSYEVAMTCYNQLTWTTSRLLVDVLGQSGAHKTHTVPDDIISMRNNLIHRFEMWSRSVKAQRDHRPHDDSALPTITHLSCNDPQADTDQTHQHIRLAMIFAQASRLLLQTCLTPHHDASTSTTPSNPLLLLPALIGALRNGARLPHLHGTHVEYDASETCLLYYLFYMRNTDLRRAIINLLRTTRAQFGIWSGRTVVPVMERWMELEGQVGERYGEGGEEEDVPEWRRLQGVRMDVRISEQKTLMLYGRWDGPAMGALREVEEVLEWDSDGVWGQDGHGGERGSWATR